MQGTILYPLSMLRTTGPQIYNEAISKYNDRTWVLEQKISPLNCLWNDAIHLIAVHPSEIKGALLKAGKDMLFEFYEIDPHLLNPTLTTVYLYNRPKGEPKEFIPFDPDALEQYSKFPDQTKEYYSKMISAGKDPLLFHLVPHILYKGSIDISTVKILNV